MSETATRWLSILGVIGGGIALLSLGTHVQHRRQTKYKERLPGGLAPGGRCPKNVISSELERGIEVELEHTNDRMIAREIACDHLTEDRLYYSKLDKLGL